MLNLTNNKVVKIILSIFIFSFLLSQQSIRAEVVNPDTIGGQFQIDYADQIKRFEHDALDNLKLADFLMCVMKVRGDLIPNANYKAQVNEAACNAIAGDADDDGIKVKMANVTMSCTRASNTAPQLCKAWYRQAGSTNVILVKMQLNTEPTTARPNGLFKMNWCFSDPSDGECKASNLGFGELSLTLDGNDKTVVSLMEESGGQRFQEYVNYNETYKDSSGNTLVNAGTAVASPVSVIDSLKVTLDQHIMDSATGSTRIINETSCGADCYQLPSSAKIYNIAFDQSHGLVSESGATDKCYPLDDPKEFVYQYDLYDKTNGIKKLIGGGIPIKVASKGTGSSSSISVDDRGYWDYWGLHVDGSTDASPKLLTTGSTVSAAVDNNILGISKDDILGVNQSMGVLKKETSFTGTIPAVDRASLTTTMYRWTETGKEYMYFQVDGSGNVTVKALDSAQGGDGGKFYDGSSFSAGDDITNKIQWCGGTPGKINNYCFGAHSDAIGGWFNLSNSSTMQFKAYVQSRLTPADVTADMVLKCYGDRCFKPMDSGDLDTDGFGATDFKNSDQQAYKDSWINPDGGTPVGYKFKSADMTLYRCENFNDSSDSCSGAEYPVICANDESSDKCNITNWDDTNWLDMRMVLASVTVGSYDNWNDATRYIWKTSNNIYGERLAWPTKSDGSAVSYDTPVSFTYEHLTTNDRNDDDTYNNKKVGLEYGGSGNLWGIDYVKESASCSGNCNYIPRINLKDGTVVDLGADEGGEHVVLGTRMDLKPDALSGSGALATCTDKGLDVSTSVTAPDTPDIETIIDFKKSDEPTDAQLVSTEVCVVDNILTGALGCPAGP